MIYMKMDVTCMCGWYTSMLTPGFLATVARLLPCPTTGLLLICSAADMLCKIFSVVNSGPTPVVSSQQS